MSTDSKQPVDIFANMRVQATDNPADAAKTDSAKEHVANVTKARVALLEAIGKSGAPTEVKLTAAAIADCLAVGMQTPFVARTGGTRLPNGLSFSELRASVEAHLPALGGYFCQDTYKSVLDTLIDGGKLYKTWAGKYPRVSLLKPQEKIRVEKSASATAALAESTRKLLGL
jgi:hypothetical protein